MTVFDFLKESFLLVYPPFLWATGILLAIRCFGKRTILWK